MLLKRIVIAAVICAVLGLACVAVAQWDESEEPQRLEQKQTDETLYDGSISENHEESIHMPKQKEPEEPPPEPGTYRTPAEEVQGTSRAN